MSSIEYEATNAPLPSTTRTSPSRSSLNIVSRTGVRLTPRRSARERSTSGSPPAISPSRIISLSFSYGPAAGLSALGAARDGMGAQNTAGIPEGQHHSDSSGDREVARSENR